MRSSTYGPSKLYVGDLGKNRKADLARLFRKYGEITTIYCDENKHFAFIEFSSPTDAQRALEHTNNRTVNGSKLRVEFAKSDKPARLDHRRAFSRDRSPTSTLLDDLQFTANRLPSMQTFRHGHYQSSGNHATTSLKSSPRGRSLTPPSLKNNPRFSAALHGRTADVYYPSISNTSSSYHYLEPNHHRNVDDPYSMQRLPPSAFQRTINSSTRNHRRSRSRSHHRTSPSHRHQNNRKEKRKRRSQSSASSSSSSNRKPRRERGPRTPPPIADRASPELNNVVSPAEAKSPLNSPPENEEKSSKSRRKSIEMESNRKHSKRKTRE